MGGPGVNITPLGLWQLRIAVGFGDLVVRPPNPMVGCYFFRIAVGFGDLVVRLPNPTSHPTDNWQDPIMATDNFLAQTQS